MINKQKWQGQIRIQWQEAWSENNPEWEASWNKGEVDSSPSANLPEPAMDCMWGPGLGFSPKHSGMNFKPEAPFDTSACFQTHHYSSRASRWETLSHAHSLSECQQHHQSNLGKTGGALASGIRLSGDSAAHGGIGRKTFGGLSVKPKSWTKCLRRPQAFHGSRTHIYESLWRSGQWWLFTHWTHPCKQHPAQDSEHSQHPLPHQG